MDLAGRARLSLRRRVWAAWLLVLFVLGQGLPVVALAATDGMTGMACCKHGRDSCCRRKPMHKVPSIQQGHACGLACTGTPMVSMRGVSAGLTSVALGLSGAVPLGLIVAVGGVEPLAAGSDLARYQRPPPFVS